jgi:hypothetical protein
LSAAARTKVQLAAALPSPPDAQKQLAFELAEWTSAEKNFKEFTQHTRAMSVF